MNGKAEIVGVDAERRVAVADDGTPEGGGLVAQCWPPTGGAWQVVGRGVGREVEDVEVGGQISPEIDGGEGGAIAEFARIKEFGVLPHDNVGEAGAKIEATSLNILDAVGNGETAERSTDVESAGKDTGKVRRQRDAGQLAASGKGVTADNEDAVRDRHGGQRGGIKCFIAN